MEKFGKQESITFSSESSEYGRAKVDNSKKKVYEKYQCRICAKWFSDFSLTRHIKYAHKEVSESLIELGRDRDYVKENGKLRCKICGKIFDLKNGFDRHFKIIHQNVRYKCDLCKKSYTRNRHNCRAKKSDFRCKFCKDYFPKEDDLQKHLEKVHSDERINCSKCCKSFYEASKAQEHFLRIHGIVKCDSCSKDFNGVFQLKEHVKLLHTESHYKCFKCLKAISHESKLVRHFSHCDKNLEDRVHKCDLCRKTFTRNQTLQRHIKNIHENTSKLVCAICNREYKNQHCLNEHNLQEHKNSTKEFKCNQCSKLFHRFDHLKTHSMEIHNIQIRKKSPVKEEKAIFQCDLCHNTFTMNCSLKIHKSDKDQNPENSHCKQCDRKFYNKGCFQNHFSKTHAKQNFKCKECDKEFTKSGKLRQHLLRLHQIKTILKYKLIQ